MSKRTKTFIALGAILLLAAVAFVGSGRGWFGIGDPAFTETIPEDRPKRLDRKFLEKFSREPIENILETLIAGAVPTEKASEEDPATALLALLPDAPLPFGEEASPRDPEGLRKFVTGMKQEGTEEPSPSEVWQFNLALAALKIDQSAVPESIRQETQPSPESEVFPVRFALRENPLFGPFAVGDFTGDHRPDIVAAGGSALYMVGNNGTCEPFGDLSSIVPGNGVFPADFDGDGKLDFFLTRGGGLPNSLLRNLGEGKFEDVTIERGLLSFNDTATAAWLDYDGDGLLDLLVGSRDHPLELYHQTSGGIFQPVAWDLGLWVPRGVRLIRVGDLSGDGYPDFYLGIEGLPDRLYLAVPSQTWSDWRFEDIAAAAGTRPETDATSAEFFDFDNDGRLDLLLASATPVPVESASASEAPGEARSCVRLFRNEGDRSFAEVTDSAGLRLEEEVAVVGTVDIDNDGYLDVFLGTGNLSINRTFWNREGSGFREVSIVTKGSYLDRPVAFAAADLEGGSGDLLYLQDSGKIRWLKAGGSDQRWLRVRVPGHPPGTRLLATVRDGDWILRTLERRLGHDSFLTIGIGHASVVERLDVFAGRSESPLRSLEKLEPDGEVVVELPKLPKQRPVVPLEESTSDTAAR